MSLLGTFGGESSVMGAVKQESGLSFSDYIHVMELALMLLIK